MDFVTLRRAGGSLVLTIPKAHARALQLREGERLGVSVKAGKLVADPSAGGRRYKLEDLLAQCDPRAAPAGEDVAWLNDRPVGGERI